MRNRRMCLIVIAVCLSVALRVFAAQENMAIALPVLITTAQVTLRRENTVQPIALRPDAIAIFGIGDTLATDGRGRALLALPDGRRILVLPSTQVTFLDFSGVRLRVSGEIVIGPTTEQTTDLTIETNTVVADPSGSAAVWANYESSDVFATDGDPVNLRLSSSVETLRGGQAIVATGTGSEIVDLRASDAPFLHAAQAIGLLRGCPAVITRTAGQSLNVRVAPGLESTPIGYIDEGAEVKIMALTESGRWARVQRFSGFGWIFQSYLDSDCTNLPSLPNNSLERNIELRDVRPSELALLEPYYGTSESNPWVYRSFRPDTYEDF